MQIIINIDVPDLKAAEQFYCEALGLVPGRRFGSTGLELLGEGSPIFLLEKAAGSWAGKSIKQVRGYTRHWTPVHLDFAVDDIERTVRNAVEAGGILEEPVSTHPWGKLALMADPFGHGFCLIQFQGRGYDAISS